MHMRKCVVEFLEGAGIAQDISRACAHHTSPSLVCVGWNVAVVRIPALQALRFIVNFSLEKVQYFMIIHHNCGA